MLKFVRYAAWGLIAVGLGTVVAIALAALVFGPGNLRMLAGINEFVAPKAAIGGQFELAGTKGKLVTDETLKGKPSALFFGFTFCPDVCPTTLSDASTWLQSLGKDADRIQIYFVTVDPERDTLEHLKEYLSAFDERIVGLTGTPEQVKTIIKAYRVFAQKVESDDENYQMNHTASVYLLDKDGRFAGTIAYQEKTENALAKLRRLIGSS
jgi:protein SCO1/2